MGTYEEETLEKLGISLEDLELFVSRSKAGQYMLIAGITLLIYDWFCTAEDEWSYMWRQKPRLRTVKVLFALNRYLPLFTLCARFSVFARAIHNPLINVAVVEIILLLRVWVIYSRNKWVGIALWSFYGIALALALAVKYLQPHTNLPFVRPPSYGENGCSKPAPGEMFFIYGIVCVAESIFFSMLIYKAWEKSQSTARTPILTALLKQGTLYYFIVLMILAVTMLAPFAGGMYFPLANGLIIVPITSVACTRLVLSLRGMVTSQEVIRGSQMGLSHSRGGGSRSNSHSQGFNDGVIGIGGGGGGGGVVHGRGMSAGILIGGTGSRGSTFPSNNTQSHSSRQTSSHRGDPDNDITSPQKTGQDEFMSEESSKEEGYALPILNHAYTNRLHQSEDEENRSVLYPPQRAFSPPVAIRRLSLTQKPLPSQSNSPVQIHRHTTVTIVEDNFTHDASGRRLANLDVGYGTTPVRTRRANSASGDLGQGPPLRSSSTRGRSNSYEARGSKRRPATADTGGHRKERDMIEYRDQVSIHPLMPSPRLP